MLVAPLQERMDDWKKVAVQLDKEHGKGTCIRQWTVHKITNLTLSHLFFHVPLFSDAWFAMYCSNYRFIKLNQRQV